MRQDDIAGQRQAFEETYSAREEARWAFNFTDDRLVRYLRDRRLRTAAGALADIGVDPATSSALVICGGVGGEGMFLRKAGFNDVTVSDFSSEALRLCRRFDSALHTLELNAEQLDVEADSFDVVLVQDGLHHLRRPVLGLTEMLRVARKAVVVVEPAQGFVGRVIGREWEEQGDTVNYVFRWTRPFLEQCVRSFTVRKDVQLHAVRIWDHGLVVGRVAERLPRPMQTLAARMIYALLRPFNRAGNGMVAVIDLQP